MKRVLFKVILPALTIGIWVLTCYPVCNKAEGFDFFLFWILVGAIRYLEDVHGTDTKELWYCREHGSVGTKCCCRWSDWRCGTYYKDFRYSS